MVYGWCLGNDLDDGSRESEVGFEIFELDYD